MSYQTHTSKIIGRSMRKPLNKKRKKGYSHRPKLTASRAESAGASSPIRKK